MNSYFCEKCGRRHWLWTNGDDGIYHDRSCEEQQRDREELSDRLAFAFHRYLQKKYPQYRWVRVREESHS